MGETTRIKERIQPKTTKAKIIKRKRKSLYIRTMSRKLYNSILQFRYIIQPKLPQYYKIWVERITYIWFSNDLYKFKKS